MKRGSILCLSPYDVYPPTHGGNTLIWNKIKKLSEYYDIHLLSPCSDHSRAEQSALEEQMAPFVKSFTPYRSDSSRSRLKDYPKTHYYWQALLGSRLPLAVLAAQCSNLCDLVESIVSLHQVDFILFEHNYSTLLVEALRTDPQSRAGKIPWIVTEHNVENRLEADGVSYSHYSWPRRCTALVQYFKMKSAERKAYRLADAFLYISSADQNYYASAYHSDQQSVVTPIVTPIQTRKVDFTATHKVIFFGSLGYFPNSDGLVWFTQKVWHQILQAVPDARFLIAGEVSPHLKEKLSCYPSLDWLGPLSFSDLDKAIIESDVVISPIHLGSGIKIKNVISIGLGMPLVGTSSSLSGIPIVNGQSGLIANEADHFAEAVVSVLLSESLRKTLSANIGTLYDQKYQPDVAIRTWLDALDSFSHPRVNRR